MLEPLGAGAQIDELLARVAAGRHTVRTLDLRTGVVTLADGDGTDVLDCNDARLITALRSALAAAGDRRRATDALRRPDGAGARLRGDDLRLRARSTPMAG